MNPLDHYKLMLAWRADLRRMGISKKTCPSTNMNSEEAEEVRALLLLMMGRVRKEKTNVIVVAAQQWARGRHFTSGHRHKLAMSYAEGHGFSEPVWTEDAERLVIEMRECGASYAEIGRRIGKTKAAVAARMRYLALGRR